MREFADFAGAGCMGDGPLGICPAYAGCGIGFCTGGLGAGAGETGGMYSGAWPLEIMVAFGSVCTIASKTSDICSPSEINSPG